MSPGHDFPQLPQFFGSVSRSTQFLPQAALPAPQLTVHWLFEQMATPVATGMHAFWHPPQLFTSLRGSIQTSPHRTNGF
jgi:hypothetical protein